MTSFAIEPMGIAFLLSAVLVCVIVAFLLLRKISFKQLIASVILSGSFVFWVSYSLGIITFPWNPQLWSKNYFIPFAALKDSLPFPSLLSEIALRMGVTFLFAVLWGLLSPALFKIRALKSFSLISIFVLFPFQLLIMVFCFTDISYYVFDTGNFILLFCGMYIGWGLFCAVQKRRKIRGAFN